jgi:protein TonB
VTRESVRWSLAAAFVTAAHAAIWLTFTRPSTAPESDAGAPVITVELSPIVATLAPAPDDSETAAEGSARSGPSPGAATAETRPDPTPRPTPPPNPPPPAAPPPPDPPPLTPDTTAVSPDPPPIVPAPAPEAPPPPPQPEPAPPAEAQATVEPPALPPGAAPAPPPSAPSAVSAHVADVAAAPAPAPGSEKTVSLPVLPRWRQELIGQIERHKRYPAGAPGHGGVVKVAFAIDEGGGLISVRIAASSGSPVLDEAAIDLIRRAAPFPPPPRGLGGSELNFVAPIHYLGAAGR